MVGRQNNEMSNMSEFKLLTFLSGLNFVITYGVFCVEVGINYGQIANNLPSHSHVVLLLQSLNITRVKLYDADPGVLTAFKNTPVEFTVGIGNENVASMRDSSKALEWIKQNIQPYLYHTRIVCITVGNEILGGKDRALMTNLLPAMKSVYAGLSSLGLQKRINVTTPHSLNILGASYPPSSSKFKSSVARYLRPILRFHSTVNSPFLINIYPYFAYKQDPDHVSLQYVLFQRNQGVTDPVTKLRYDNMLYAQIDCVHSAIRAMTKGFSAAAGVNGGDIDVKISETGWPSKGDSNEPGATPENAGIYNRNLMGRIRLRQGTPLKPSVPIDAYVFALFNENLKPGPTSERNYGLLYPTGKPVYSLLESRNLSPPIFVVYSSSASSKPTNVVIIDRILIDLPRIFLIGFIIM